ncbi:MAG: hypothetical protein AB7G06_01420 [Bdellovibrionales bacterium]
MSRSNPVAYWSPEIQDRSNNPFALEGFLIFCILAAARESGRASNTGAMLLHDRPAGVSPLTHIHNLGHKEVENRILKSGLGYQGQKTSFLMSAAEAVVVNGLDLRTASIDDLESIKGVAEKTSRFFRLFSFPKKRLRHAILDVHVMRFIADYDRIVLGKPATDVPEITPTGAAYRRYEKQFLEICDFHRRPNPKFDFKVWSDFKAHSQGKPEPRRKLLNTLARERGRSITWKL